MATFDFEAFKNDVTRQAETAQRQVSGLYQDDGQPVYTETIHQQHIQRALAPLETAVAEAHELCERADIEARKLEALRHLDPLSSLSNDELIRLNAARELAQDEIAQFELLPDQLGDRLDAVLAHGDRVSQVLHMIYGRPIAERRGDPLLHEKIAALDEAAYGKERARATKAIQEAESLREQAAQLRFYASLTLGEVNGSNADALQRKRAEYQQFF